MNDDAISIFSSIQMFSVILSLRFSEATFERIYQNFLRQSIQILNEILRGNENNDYSANFNSQANFRYLSFIILKEYFFLGL